MVFRLATVVPATQLVLTSRCPRLFAGVKATRKRLPRFANRLV
jgi:hypothetical protein